jgi:hypothetical protein
VNPVTNEDLVKGTQCYLIIIPSRFYYGVMKSRKHERQTNISMSLPVKLAEEITAAAKSENRSRSNWIVTKLRELLATKK